MQVDDWCIMQMDDRCIMQVDDRCDKDVKMRIALGEHNLQGEDHLLNQY